MLIDFGNAGFSEEFNGGYKVYLDNTRTRSAEDAATQHHHDYHETLKSSLRKAYTLKNLEKPKRKF